MDVKRALGQLIEVQRLETEFGAVESDLAAHPGRVAEVEASLASARAGAEEARGELERVHKRHRGLELEVEEVKQRISRHQDQLMQAKNNVEYRGLTKEIAHEKEQIEEGEDQILVLMERADEVAVVIADKEKVLAVEERRVAGERADLDASRVRLEKEREQLQSDLAELRDGVAPPALSLYERIRNLRGTGVSRVSGGLCGACRVRVRPQMLEEARTHQRLVQCEICSRILEAPPVDPAAQPVAVTEDDDL